MKYKAECYGSLCSLSLFVINGKEAEAEDFVDKYDHSPEEAYDYSPEEAKNYGCGDMRAEPLPVNQKILIKYDITEEEYFIIANDIAEKLSFGNCEWCI